ncbi:UNVERIFIED_CONTAM: hypothetical protein Sradi_5009800 [Sesamum radiatum]|uniref:Uncharacterized protein n=1 Tax=Sesamum radiatum TaxID=300843 RepID=A0AAW2MIC8_SESRA
MRLPSLKFLVKHFADIGAGEAGLAVLVCLAVQYAIAAVVIAGAGAGALFVVDLRLRGIEVHHVVKGEGPRLQGVEADLSCGLHGIHNLQGIQTKATQGHHLEVPHGKTGLVSYGDGSADSGRD